MRRRWVSSTPVAGPCQARLPDEPHLLRAVESRSAPVVVCGVGYELVNGFRPRRSPDGLRIAAGQGVSGC